MKDNSFYNSQGYPDPVPYEVMRAWEESERDAGRNPGYRPMVFICSPYAGNIERNVSDAQKYCRMAVERGYLPIAPHLLFPQFLDDSDSDERELGMFMGRVLLHKCREVWVFGESFGSATKEKAEHGHNPPVCTSAGMDEEIREALSRKIPVRYFDRQGKEVD